jgi:hypothetical protein
VSAPNDEEWGSTMTVDRRQRSADDVAAARAGVRRAGVTYGPRDSRRLPRDTLADWTRGFVQRYGWRAYAVPVLLIVTIAALMTSTTVARHNKSSGGAVAQDAGAKGNGPPPVAGSHIALKDDAPGANSRDSVLKAAALPAGPQYTKAGDGSYRVLRGKSGVVGHGQLYRYSIDVETGIAKADQAHFESMISSVLADKRSWSGHGVALQRVDSGQIDFHVTLTSPMTIRKVCGYTIPVETSCYVQAGSVTGVDVNRVAINDARWVRGDAAYLGDLNAYRIYMINHEDGHALNHQHAHQCLPGGLAPVMMQQTFGLKSAQTGKLCQANPWPYPPGAKGVPGAEQPDTAANNEYGLDD